MKAKVAFVTDVIYPYRKDGVSIRMWKLSRGLAKAGVEVHVYTLNWWGGEEVIQLEGVYLHGVCKPKELYTRGGRRSIGEALYFSLGLMPQLLKADFDIIECAEFPYLPCIPAKIASILRRRPMIISWFEVWDRYWFGYLPFMFGLFGYLIERVVSKLPNHIVSISTHTTNQLVKKLGIRQEKVSTIPIGIDVEEIQEIKVEKIRERVAYVGRLVEHKHVDWLIRALPEILREVPKAQLVIVGDGPEIESLKDLTKKLRIIDHVIFRGATGHHEALHVIKSSRVLVLPSTREGQGLVVLEALAANTPVVGVDANGSAVSEFIKIGGHGILVAPNRPTSLAHSVITVLKNDAFLLGFKENRSQSVRDFDWTKITQEVLKLYARLLRMRITTIRN